MSLEKAREVTKSINDLPTLPAVITKVLELIKNPKANASDIGNALASDIALSSKILRIVNSAFYGFSRKISTVTQAVVILGFNTVKSAVLGVSVIDAFKNKKVTNDNYFDLEGFWQHSIACAAAARVIAKRSRFKFVEEAFISGLIHDIGKLILDLYLGEEYKKVIKYVNEYNTLIYEAENEILGFTHSEVGSTLIDIWQFPQSFSKAVLFHHKPKDYKESDLDGKMYVSINHFADIIVKALDIGQSIDNKVPPLESSVVDTLKIDVSLLGGMIKDVQREISNSGEFLSL